MIDGLEAPRRLARAAVAASLLAPLALPRLRLPRLAPARTEVHTLVSAAHSIIYVHSVRSLLRFWPNLGVVVHDDGTLRRRDWLLIKANVPGARVVWKPEADARMASLLRDRPRVAELRARNVRILQLLDYHLLASPGAASVVGMDSDILFLRRPDTLIDWAERSRSPEGLYSPERFPNSVPKGVHWIPDTFPGRAHVGDICCGLVALRRGFPDVALLDELIARTPPEILWHGRFVTQMFYSLLMGALPAVRSLGEDYRAGRMAWLRLSPESAALHVAYHYMASHDRGDTFDNFLGERHAFALATGSRLARLAVRAYDHVERRERLRAAGGPAA